MIPSNLNCHMLTSVSVISNFWEPADLFFKKRYGILIPVFKVVHVLARITRTPMAIKFG